MRLCGLNEAQGDTLTFAGCSDERCARTSTPTSDDQRAATCRAQSSSVKRSNSQRNIWAHNWVREQAKLLPGQMRNSLPHSAARAAITTVFSEERENSREASWTAQPPGYLLKQQGKPISLFSSDLDRELLSMFSVGFQLDGFTKSIQQLLGKTFHEPLGLVNISVGK